MPSPKGAQDLHENVLSIGDAASLLYQSKMNDDGVSHSAEPTLLGPQHEGSSARL